MIAANNIYSVAKPDGLSVAMLSYGLYLDQLVGRKEVQYDVRKLNWIGSPEKSEVLIVHARRRAFQNDRGYPQREHAA